MITPGGNAARSPRGLSPGNSRRRTPVGRDAPPPTPRGLCDTGFFDWFIRIRNSPTQVTAKLSPFNFLVRFAWFLCLFLTITRTIPVDDLSVAVEGLNAFANEVRFNRLDGSTANLKDVTTLDDAVEYEKAFVKELLPVEQYGHVPRAADSQLYIMRVHRILHNLVLAQRRVKPTDCAYKELESLYPNCYESLSPDNEDKSPIFRPAHGNETRTAAASTYDDILHAHVVHLPVNREAALGEMDRLIEERWWDRATRQSSIRFAIHNAPGHFSGYCMLVFEFSPYGLVSHSMDIQFLRLRPYSKEVNGETLWHLQLLCGSMLLFLIMQFCYGAVMQPHPRWTLAFLLRPWAFVDYAIFYLVFRCISQWVVFMSSPVRTSWDPNTATGPLDGIAELSTIFAGITFYLAILLLFSVLRVLEYMVLVEQLRHQYVAIANAMVDMGWFGLMFMILFGGFVISGHTLFGVQVPMFADLSSTGLNMMLWLMTLGSGQDTLLSLPGGSLFLPLFLFICLVLIFNILLAILLGSFEKEGGGFLSRSKPVNHVVADSICDCLGVRPYDQDPYLLYSDMASPRDEEDSARDSARIDSRPSGMKRTEKTPLLQP